jgi:leucyl-tRNA synthetase
VNGKVKSRIIIPAAASEKEVEGRVLKDPKTQAALQGKTILQKKYVPKKIFSIAVS